MKKLVLIIFICIISVFSFSCKSKDKINPKGVWWWDDTLSDEYLYFAKNNNVTEIYYCNDSFNENTSIFINKANSYGIKVYWLAGEYKWLDDSTNLYNKINKYEEYQKIYTKFDGIHLDIEPHQSPDFDNNREKYILKLIELANDLKNTYNNIRFDYDIPFWFDDLILFNNENKEAYKHMIDISYRVFLMSYRDSAEKIYDVSKDEIEYAKKTNKILFLGVETTSNEGNNVSFQEEGKKYMDQEINKLIKMIPNSYGISVHQIKSWYVLKEE